MPRAIKCQQCELKEDFDSSKHTSIDTVAKSGRVSKKYFHNECLNKYISEKEQKTKEKEEKAQKELETKEFKRIEAEARDRLVEVAGQIHNAPKPPNLAYQFPRFWYHTIQDIRNGTDRYSYKFKRRYKEGIPYDILAEAYKLSQDGIKWAKMDKQFKDFSAEVRYCLAIVRNKIPDALKKAERDAHMEKVKEVREREELENMKYDRETVFQKKKANYDISDLLD